MVSNKLHADSQLMQHMLPADPIDTHHHLQAVRDEKEQPLIFSEIDDSESPVLANTDLIRHW